MENNNFIRCPLVGELIENIDCIENADAVDGMIKRDSVPERFKVKVDWETICKNCRWHNY